MNENLSSQANFYFVHIVQIPKSNKQKLQHVLRVIIFVNQRIGDPVGLPKFEKKEAYKW